MKRNQSAKIALLLALLSLSGTLSSCGGTAGTASDDPELPAETLLSVPETETETEDASSARLSELSALDYGGRDFCVIGRLEYDDELCVSESDGEVLNDAVYDRNQAMQELLNVNLTWEIGENEYSDFGKTAILAGEDTYDAMMIHSRMAFNFMNDGLLHDWNEDMPYTDLSASYWSQDMREHIAVGNKIYFMSGDISYYFLADTQVMLFNKRLFRDLDFASPYQTVRDGKWTFDYMKSLASTAAADLDGDGVMKGENDRLGYITTHWRGPNFVYIAEGTRLITLDGNKMPEFTLDLARSEQIYTRYLEFLQSDAAKMFGEVEDASMLNVWMSGEVLFFDGLLKYASRMRDMEDDFGVLPMPKFDEAQENYLSTPGAGINFYAVPVSAGDTECTSAVLETLAVLGQRDVMPAYYEEALKGKYARDEESAEMLDLIRQNIIVDFGSLIYGHTVNKLNSIGYFLSDPKNKLGFSAFYDANIKTFEKYLQEVIELLS